MSWPLSQDYNEAIQDPQTSFSDTELRGGEAVCNALGMPMPRSGNFADVYEFNTPATKAKWAIKCFTRHVPGLRERYTEISRALQESRLPFAVDFQYLVKGIRVRSDWFPILKMRWVEGQLLNEIVRDNLDKPAVLNQLVQIWGRMGKRLRETGIAHADLQHGNVLFIPGSQKSSLAVKLIDYDGMFVPALNGKKSGEVGHPNYQHPIRLKEGTYSPVVDRFPLLVVATALRALSVGGRSLWERYDNGDNLLFKETDLREPGQSAVFKDLMSLADPQTRTLTGALLRAIQGKQEEVPPLDELLSEAKPASVRVPAVGGNGSSAAITKAPTVAAPQMITTAPPAIPMASPVDALDFGDAAPRLVKRRAASPKTAIPLWAWIAGGATAAAVLISLLMVFLGQGKGKDKIKEDLVVAPKKSDDEPVKDVPKDNKDKKADPPVKPAPVPDPIKPAPVPDPVKPAPVPSVVPPAGDAQSLDVGFEDPIDPNKDCKFVHEKGVVTFEVPATLHDLSIEKNLMTAPRLLREVEGDFVVQVRVESRLDPMAPSTSPFAVPFQGAGLVVIADDRTYVRFERAGAGNAANTGAAIYYNWEFRLDGKKVRTGAIPPRPSGTHSFLRIDRRGDQFISQVSSNGRDWSPSYITTLELPNRVKLGLVAITTSSQPFRARFDQWQLTQGEKKATPPPVQAEPVKLYLSDLKESGWRGMSKFANNGKMYNGKDIACNGVKSPHGLGTHPIGNGDANVSYKLDGLEAIGFQAKVAINDDVPKESSTPLTFQVLGDGKVLWSSTPMRSIHQTQDCPLVNVESVRVLELRVLCPGSVGWAHAVWLEPVLLTKKGLPAKVVGTPSSEDERKAVEWLLSIGGRVTIKKDNNFLQIAAAKDLPAEAWHVYGIYLFLNKRVPDTDLVHLKALPRLNQLDIHGTQVNDAWLEHLKEMSTLTNLTVLNTQVSDAGLAHVQGLTNLMYLNLSNSKVTNAGLEHLKTMTNLHQLSLIGTQVGDAGLDHLNGLPKLMTLSLGGTQVSDAGLASLKTWPSLHALDLNGTQVSDAGLEHLKGITILSNLTLSNTKVSDAGLVQLKGLTKLSFLNLTNTQISDAGLEQLKGLTNLNYLNVSNTKVSDAGLEYLKGLTKLNFLDVSNTQVSDTGLEQLKGLTNLGNLMLSKTQVSDAGLKHLYDLRKLTFLHLSNTKVTVDGVAALQKALPNCKVFGVSPPK